MKRALILHGTDSDPTASWFPWLEDKLKDEGYNVWVPLLPGNHTPNREVYNDYLLSQDWDFVDNIVIGHSAGAVSVLNLLMDERCPKVKLAVMVSAWKGGQPNGHFEPDQFDHLFSEKGFDFARIKANADKFAFIHSDDDPFCPLEQAADLASELDASLLIMHDAKHIGGKTTELPEVWQIIKSSL